MPVRDWIKTRVFSWLASLLHFDKLLQIPFIILHEVCGISYKDLIEAFMKKAHGENILNDIVSALEDKAASIQNGGSEYSMSPKWLNTAWYPDELILINICAGDQIDTFYREAEARLVSLAKNYPTDIRPQVITDAVRLNRAVLKQPYLTDNTSIQCTYNIWEIYQAALSCEQEELAKSNFKYEIDRTSQQWTSWNDWCREVVWYGNKKGDYIYPVKRSV